MLAPGSSAHRPAASRPASSVIAPTVGPSRRDVRLQQQADRCVRQDRHLRGECQRRCDTSSATRPPRQCSARDSEGHGTHTRRRPPATVTSADAVGVQRGPVCGIAPGARVIEYRVCLASGCFGSDWVAAIQQAIADGGDVDQLLDLGRCNPYRTRSSSHSSMRSTGDHGQRLGRQLRSGCVDLRSRWSVDDDRGCLDGTARVRLHPAPHRGRRRSARRSGRDADDGGSRARPGRPGRDAAKAGGGHRGRALPVGCSPPARRASPSWSAHVATNGRIDKGRRVFSGGAAGMILTNQSAG